jgi:hypothetical protein
MNEPLALEIAARQKVFRLKIELAAAMRSVPIQIVDEIDTIEVIVEPAIPLPPHEEPIDIPQFALPSTVHWREEIGRLERPFDHYPKIAMIKRITAAAFGIAASDLDQMRRTVDVVRPRQAALYLCVLLSGRSLPYIGRMFCDGLDHTTVLHASRIVPERMKLDDHYAAQINAARASIEALQAYEAST